MLEATFPNGTILLGKYRVERALGRGGAGVVLAARHVELGELFAIKVLDLDRIESPNATRRFLREARAAARLTSEHVARVVDVGHFDSGAPYLVMEHLAGDNLSRVLEQRGSLPLDEATGLVIDACDALGEAHALGIVHRDVKLTNLFVAERRGKKPCLKVIDFGISKDEGASEALTRAGAFMGSAASMAPEQIRDPRAVDGRCDLWALGVVLYQLTTGKAPFYGGSLPELLKSVLRDSPPPPGQIRPDLPEAFDDVVMCCLEKRPQDRYPSAGALAEALLSFAAPSSKVVVRVGQGPLSCGGGTDATLEVEAPPNVTAELPDGIVRRRSPFFVARPGVEEACEREVKKPGGLLRIKGPRQTGKSSLMTGIVEDAAGWGARAVTLNVQMADAAMLASPDRLLRWLCASVARRLKLSPRLIEDQWDDIFGAKDNCTAYFEEHLLAQGEPLVVAIDHLDRVFESPGTAEELLSLLRAWHEMGKSRSPWEALRLVLVYATEMYLPLRINHSPFNVGLPVALGAWDAGEVQALAGRHGLSWGVAEVDRVMELLGGHPHLVRILLYHVACGARLDEVLAAGATDEGLFGDHLRYLLWHVQEQPALREATARVMASNVPVRLDTEVAFKLVSLGLVELLGNEVKPARELYRRYFVERLG